MIDWVIVLAGLVMGLAGSPHCAGMCGPLVGLMESGSPGQLAPAERRMFYQLGRVVFYISLAVTLAALGAAALVVLNVPEFVTALRLLAAMMLLLTGLQMLTGKPLLAFMDRAGKSLWRVMTPLLKQVFPLDARHKALVAGFVWGAIPCGMVYAAVVIAATSASLPTAALTMLAFWAGTLPMLTAIGLTIGASKRAGSQRLAGVAVTVLALVSVILLLPASHHEPQHHQHHSSQVGAPAHHH